MKLIETRKLETAAVRRMCIDNQFYTYGTCEEYEEMFKKCMLGCSVLEIAKDIWEHTDKQKFMDMCGTNEIGMLEAISYKLINDCSYTCVQIEE